MPGCSEGPARTTVAPPQHLLLLPGRPLSTCCSCPLLPVLQNFYYEHPAVTSRSEDEIRRYREQRDIHVTGEGVPKPVSTFEEASFPGEPGLHGL